MFRKSSAQINLAMKIDIWDIDGTMTYVHGDITDTSGYNTYAFWPLISKHFTKDAIQLQQMIDAWEASMKTEPDPTGSSHAMMQKSIETFKENITSQDVSSYAKELTLQFIKHGVIRNEAIQHFEARLSQGVVCILSTGSYEDGARGFVDALIENGMLSKKSAELIRLSGAVVDWEKRILLHANVRERKLTGIEKVMGRNISLFKGNIENVYADDPWVNDQGIISIAPPSGAHVITTVKNKDKQLPSDYRFTTWSSILNAARKEIRKIRNECCSENRYLTNRHIFSVPRS